MTKNDELIADVVKAWRLASTRLGIRVIAPFDFQVDDKVQHCIAFLPDFGGQNGMTIQVIIPPDFSPDSNFKKVAHSAGYYVSFINANLYSSFDASRFKDALEDWGFFGDAKSRPEWFRGILPYA